MGEDYADANQLAINNLSLSDLLVQRDIAAALNSTLLCQLSPETMWAHLEMYCGDKQQL